MNHGLSAQQLTIIKTLLAPYADHIDGVYLFGSRATSTHRPNSDVDLVLRGSLSEKHIDRLWTEFQESSLALSVDVKSYDRLTYPPLKSQIDKVMQPLFTQKVLQQHLRTVL